MDGMVNSKESRQEVLKEIITSLHNGKSIEDVELDFSTLIKGISPSEIYEMEEALVREGVPIQEALRLWDIHGDIFREVIEDTHHQKKTLGHPVHALKLENRMLKEFVERKVLPDIDAFDKNDCQDTINMLLQDFQQLIYVDKHYLRKENILFPYLDMQEMSNPEKTIWGVDDEIRRDLEEVRKLISDYSTSRNDAVVKDKIVNKSIAISNRIIEMIFKEDSILFPAALKSLSEDGGLKIKADGTTIGYAFPSPDAPWTSEKEGCEKTDVISAFYGETRGEVAFATGSLDYKELGNILDTLPIDITFIDKEDIVKYYSHSQNRIFNKIKNRIGMPLLSCCPEVSLAVLDKLLDDFKSGSKNSEDFYMYVDELFVLIRYFAIRDENNEYMGTLEVSQNINPLINLKGEKRLLS